MPVEVWADPAPSSGACVDVAVAAVVAVVAVDANLERAVVVAAIEVESIEVDADVDADTSAGAVDVVSLMWRDKVWSICRCLLHKREDGGHHKASPCDVAKGSSWWWKVRNSRRDLGGILCPCRRWGARAVVREAVSGTR